MAGDSRQFASRMDAAQGQAVAPRPAPPRSTVSNRPFPAAAAAIAAAIDENIDCRSSDINVDQTRVANGEGMSAPKVFPVEGTRIWIPWTSFDGYAGYVKIRFDDAGDWLPFTYGAIVEKHFRRFAVINPNQIALTLAACETQYLVAVAWAYDPSGKLVVR